MKEKAAAYIYFELICRIPEPTYSNILPSRQFDTLKAHWMRDVDSQPHRCRRSESVKQTATRRMQCPVFRVRSSHLPDSAEIQRLESRDILFDLTLI